MLIIISGPSGTGKNSIINGLLDKIYNLEIMKTCTTRKARKSDNNYFYFSEEEFQKMKDNNEFFETEMVHPGLWYGVLNKSMDDVIKSEKIYIKDIDVHGAQKISEFLKGKVNVIKIFVDAPNDVLRERLIKRGETEEKADARLARADYERTFKNKYDYVIENNEFEASVRLVYNYIEKRKNARL